MKRGCRRDKLAQGGALPSAPEVAAEAKGEHKQKQEHREERDSSGCPVELKKVKAGRLINLDSRGFVVKDHGTLQELDEKD